MASNALRVSAKHEKSFFVNKHNQPSKKPMKRHEKKCLLCDEPEKTRGLCNKHYARFNSKVNAIEGEESKQRYNDLAVENGWVKAVKPRGPQKADGDVFDQLYEFVVAEQTEDYEVAQGIAAALKIRDERRSESAD